MTIRRGRNAPVTVVKLELSKIFKNVLLQQGLHLTIGSMHATANEKA